MGILRRSHELSDDLLTQFVFVLLSIPQSMGLFTESLFLSSYVGSHQSFSLQVGCLFVM